ncbi:UNVERIFIED_ORG: hypothetical protein ABRZ91_001865 [Heyndrickxia coagulans]|jgi:hypothetical protein
MTLFLYIEAVYVKEVWKKDVLSLHRVRLR